MTPVLLNQTFQKLALADMIAGDSLTGAKLHLYSNNVVFDPDTTLLGGLTESAFAGYAAGGVALVFAAPSVSDDLHVESAAAQIVFRSTNAVTPEDAYGYFITEAGGGLIGGGTFDDGFLPFRSADDMAGLTIVIRPDGTGYCSVVS